MRAKIRHEFQPKTAVLTRKLMLAGFFVLTFASQAKVLPAQIPQTVFQTLARAYKDRDADAAAKAYSQGAVVIYDYSGKPKERYSGRSEIRESFARFFGRLPREDVLDLDFRLDGGASQRATGIYRLRFGKRAESYGRFDVTFDTNGIFASDNSTSATLDDFERAAGALVVHADAPAIGRAFYSRLTGRYRMPNGCYLIVTRSSVRLFARNSCTGDWRGLERVSGLEWTSGPTILSKEVNRRYQFADPVDGASAWLRLNDSADTQLAKRETPYSTSDVTFSAPDGTRLGGTIYRPEMPRSESAVVIVHGSGLQDRDGYASIIALIADEIAANGRTVLTFDKRGSGASDGDGTRASFDVLADDAIAAMEFLRKQEGVDPKQVGLAGSSQAGWVVATAIERGARPVDVFLLGAAGTAMTVARQNVYNTRVRMQCAGIDPRAVDLAIEQQKAFFAAIANPTTARRTRLDRLSARARATPAIRDWLFPNSAGLGARDGEWFTVLDPSFDPLPTWEGFRGSKIFVFSEHDDSTDTVSTIGSLQRRGISSRVLKNAQHLGLKTDSRCHGEIDALTTFSPDLFKAIREFAHSE